MIFSKSTTQLKKADDRLYFNMFRWNCHILSYVAHIHELELYAPNWNSKFRTFLTVCLPLTSNLLWCVDQMISLSRNIEENSKVLSLEHCSKSRQWIYCSKRDETISTISCSLSLMIICVVLILHWFNLSTSCNGIIASALLETKTRSYLRKIYIEELFWSMASEIKKNSTFVFRNFLFSMIETAYPQQMWEIFFSRFFRIY